jgi:peptidoglycan/LPS O-acetylase OafA/YrhL
LYLTHAPIVAIVCERIVRGRVATGVPTFLVSLALVLPLTIGFARVFAGVFEIPFQRSRNPRTATPRHHPGAQGVPA